MSVVPDLPVATKLVHSDLSFLSQQCRGTPYINPVLSHDPANPGDRSKWKTQHPVLQWLDPPLVYNVFLGDSDGLTKAVAKALEHPINRCLGGVTRSSRNGQADE